MKNKSKIMETIGTESIGKSTLTEILINQLNIDTIKEFNIKFAIVSGENQLRANNAIKFISKL